MDLKHYADIRTSKGQLKTKKNRRYKKIDSLLSKGESILDIWCADWSFYETRKHKKIKYSWIDYNNNFVEYCVKKWLDVKQCDISKDKIPHKENSFDIIYCSHVIEHLLTNEQIYFMKEVNRVLKKWGKAIFFAPTPYHRYFRDDSTHQRPCTHWQLFWLTQDAWFKVIESKYSLINKFPQKLQRRLRLPPLRRFLWEVYIVVKK